MDILNEKIEGLVKKAEKSGMPYSILKKVYDRGMAAWKTGHRPGTTPQQWAFARVNSFVTKSSGTWGKADKDLADKVRGAKKEEIENPKKAKDIVGQVKEKLGKDADAGDYVKDFRKSKAPQFKGQSDKKIQKMAIAAYLDSKEENVQEQIKTFNRNSLTASDKSKLSKHFDKLAKDSQVPPENQDAYKAVSNYVSMKTKRVDFDDIMKKASAGLKQDVEIEMSRIIGKSKTKKVIESKEENIQESGHTDVASMKTQVQIAMDALQKMQMNLGKLTDEDDLPTWWTNKVATAVNKLDGMADYIDAMHDRGKEMNEEKCPTCDTDPCKCENLTEGRMKELHGYIQRGMSAQAIAKKMKLDVKTIEALMKEEKRQLKDPKKETMVMKIKDAGSIQVIDKKDLNKFLSKGYIQVESNEEDLDEGKFTLPTRYVIVDTRTNKVTHASSDDKDLKLDVGRKSHLKIVKLKKPVSQKKTGYLLGEPLKAWGEEVELDEQKVFVFRYEYKGKRYAAPFGSEKDAKEAMKAAMKDRNVKDTSITQDILKRGVKFVEDVDIEEVAQNDAFVVTGGPGDNAQKVIAVFKDKGNGLKDAKKARDDYNKKNRPTKATHKARIYRQSRLSQSRNKFKPGEQIKYSTYGNKQQFTKLKEDIEIVEFIDEAVLAGRDYNYDGKSPIKISKKMYAKVQRDSKSMIKGKPYMMALNPKTQGTELVPVVFEEVDNSLAAQASRVISQTAIREKKDPADIDMTATDLDRKAADKNIFVQLKRAQDMKGKGDIEFLDKKKKKVDIRIINKAIDMMMKMKPADRAKMQTAIGKSYRDLLKTVQRGKV